MNVIFFLNLRLMYHYWGFGLTIESEIEFPELLPFKFEKAEITIRLGKTPEQLNGDDVIEKVRVFISPAEYLLKVLNIANYYAANGTEIIIEPLPGADEKSVRLFMLSNAMAAILHQRNMIPLHASAIHHQDGVVLFCGRSGAGKSTTATALQKQGYKVFSDDVCVLKEIDGELMVLPSYPMMKLWEDSFAKVGMEMAGEEDKIRPHLPKYARWYHAEFSIDPMPVKQIFIIDPSNQAAEISIKKTGAIEAFQELQKNTYRPVQTSTMKKRDIHFMMVSRLAGSAPVAKVTRPQHGNSIEELTRYIQSVLKEEGIKEAAGAV